jgi:hypothetical protein
MRRASSPSSAIPENMPGREFTAPVSVSYCKRLPATFSSLGNGMNPADALDKLFHQ